MLDPLVLDPDKRQDPGLRDTTTSDVIIVVGDLSSGKSSVLEAITRIPFPRPPSLITGACRMKPLDMAGYPYSFIAGEESGFPESLAADVQSQKAIRDKSLVFGFIDKRYSWVSMPPNSQHIPTCNSTSSTSRHSSSSHKEQNYASFLSSSQAKSGDAAHPPKCPENPSLDNVNWLPLSPILWDEPDRRRESSVHFEVGFNYRMRQYLNALSPREMSLHIWNHCDSIESDLVLPLLKTDDHRMLKQYHSNMIALSGVIGAGLFTLESPSGKNCTLSGWIAGFIFGGLVVWSTLSALVEVTELFSLSLVGEYPIQLLDPDGLRHVYWLQYFIHALKRCAPIILLGVWARHTTTNLGACIILLYATIVLNPLVSVRVYSKLEHWFGCAKIAFLIGVLLLLLVRTKAISDVEHFIRILPECVTSLDTDSRTGNLRPTTCTWLNIVGSSGFSGTSHPDTLFRSGTQRLTSLGDRSIGPHVLRNLWRLNPEIRSSTSRDLGAFTSTIARALNIRLRKMRILQS